MEFNRTSISTSAEKVLHDLRNMGYDDKLILKALNTYKDFLNYKNDEDDTKVTSY